MVKFLHKKGMKLKAALMICGIKKATFYYKGVPEDMLVMSEIKSIAQDKYFYGYRRIWAEIRKEGMKVNKKKVYRLYKEMGLQKIRPTRKPRKINENRLQEIIKAQYPNQIWAMDFTWTKLSNCRSVKVLSIEDIYSRKSILTYCDYSITGEDVVENLKKALGVFEGPRKIISDNGPEFISTALKLYLNKERICHEYIEKGKPYLNGLIERFIGSLKSECLICGGFDSLQEVRCAVYDYQKFYNTERPHQSLEYQTPDAIFYSKRNSENLKTKKILISYGNQDIIIKR